MTDYIPLPPQYGNPLIILNTISASLSLAGSSCILFMARREFFGQILQRIMCYISLSDIFYSLTILVMPFVLPEQMDLSYAAFGNTRTCEAFGFLLSTFLWTGCCYNCFLSLYFLATVRYQFKEPSMTYRKIKIPLWEMGVLIATLLLPLVCMSVAVAMNAIHPQAILPICYFSTSPYGCEGDSECGVHADEKLVYGLTSIAYLFSGLIIFVSFGSTFFLYWTVRQKMKRSSQFRFSGATKSSGIGGSMSTSNNSHTTGTQFANSHTTTASMGQCSNTHTSRNSAPAEDPFQKRVQQVRTQAILYAIIYFNSFIWASLLGGLTATMEHDEAQEAKTDPGVYTLQLLAVIFGPLQGFLNFFVYIRPKVLRWRAVETEESLFWVVQQVLAGTEIPSSAAAYHRRKRLRAQMKNAEKSPVSGGALSSTIPESNVVLCDSIAHHDVEHGEKATSADSAQLISSGITFHPALESGLEGKAGPVGIQDKIPEDHEIFVSLSTETDQRSSKVGQSIIKSQAESLESSTPTVAAMNPENIQVEGPIAMLPECGLVTVDSNADTGDMDVMPMYGVENS